MRSSRSRLIRIVVAAASTVFLGGLGYGVRALQQQSSPRPAAESGFTLLKPTGSLTAADGKMAALTPTGQLVLQDKKGQPGALCPLKQTDVTADVAGYMARVTVEQQFVNPSKEPVEALYTFPLPEDAAVDNMTMRVGNRLVLGEIKRREEAREIYENARANGQAAALLDQERPNIFSQSVANIMPGESVTITISYVHLLKYDEGKYTWSFPMVVGPRYVPSGGYMVPGKRGDPGFPPPTADSDSAGTTPVVTDAQKITPPITPPGTRAGHDISVTVNLDAGLPLRDVESVLHTVRMRRAGATRATITLRNDGEIPNRDFILRWSAAGSEVQSGLLTYAPAESASRQVASASRAAFPVTTRSAGGYFTLILQPPAAPARETVTPKEMVFVIDQTGSQSGWPIEKAKETMRHCIQNLNPGDTFQLLGFNTKVYPCFPAPVPATPETVQAALDYLKPMQGSGGTDILKAADYALKIPSDPDRIRIICYMTDGYVGNDMQILDYIAKNRGGARMFPFGVGNSVNRFLIEGMAREGRGVPEFVTLNESGEVAADRFYRRVADPLLLNISVDWNGLPVEDVYPRNIPDVFSAGPIIVKGRYTRATEGDITIHGLLRGKPWSQRLHINLPAQKADGSAIATLWARERIEDLQNSIWLGTQGGNPDPKIQEEIVNTALNYRLMSQFTSFVAVEERVVNVGGKQRTLDVPVEMPDGVSYEGIFGDKKEERAAFSKRTLTTAGSVSSAGGRLGITGGFMGGMGGGGYGGVGRSPVPAAAAAPQKSLALPSVNSIVSSDADNSLLLDDTESAKKRLEAMKPEDRRALLRRTKLTPDLQKLVADKKPTGAVEVQVWLNSLPPEGLDKLKALGFKLSATLTPNKLLLGTISPAQLDTLLELSWVRRVDLPKYR